MIIADTDVLIDFLSGQEPAATVVAEHVAGGRLSTTVISRFELLAGVRSARQERPVRRLLDALPILALEREAADRAATVRRALEGRGAGIGMADSLITGIVLAHGAELLTRNRRHFERVPGLRLGRLEPR